MSGYKVNASICLSAFFAATTPLRPGVSPWAGVGLFVLFLTCLLIIAFNPKDSQ